MSTRLIHIDYSISNLPLIPLGVDLGIQGEGGFNSISFDVWDWTSGHDDAIVRIEAQRPGEDTIYIANTELRDNEYLFWNITDYDTAKAGYGTFQVVMSTEDGTVIHRSHIVRTSIAPSQNGSLDPNPPQPEPSWVQALIESRKAPVIEVEMSEVVGFDPVEFHFTEEHRAAINNSDAVIGMIIPGEGYTQYFLKTTAFEDYWQYFSFGWNGGVTVMIVEYTPSTGDATVTQLN